LTKEKTLITNHENIFLKVWFCLFVSFFLGFLGLFVCWGIFAKKNAF